MEKLLLYVDPKWQRQGLQHTPLLYPFWGSPLTPSQPFWKGLFDKRGYDTNYFTITDVPEKADMVLMPYSHTVVLGSYPELLELCLREARRQGKKLLIDGLGDVEHPIPHKDVLVLRYGGYRFKKESHSIHIPLYADDLLEMYRGGALDIRQKRAKPVIGFAGWADLPLKQEIRSVLKELPVRFRALFDQRYQACKKGIFFRREAIRRLQAASTVETNFIVRSSFSANAHTMSGSPEELRREFVENLLAADYGLCIRGDANGSVRLFETLALGRIPIIIDTECNFPFSDEVDYSTFSLIVDFLDMEKLPHRIATFHEGLSNEQFIEMQKAARAAYVQHFRVDALMPHILREIGKLTDSARVLEL